jgi:hypothetical protein
MMVTAYQRKTAIRMCAGEEVEEENTHLKAEHDNTGLEDALGSLAIPDGERNDAEAPGTDEMKPT